MTYRDTLRSQLKALCQKIQVEIQSNAILIKRIPVYSIERQVVDFRYTKENGPVIGGWNINYKDCIHLIISPDLLASIKKISEYSCILQNVDPCVTKALTSESLDIFVDVTSRFLAKDNIDNFSLEGNIDLKIAAFLGDIYNEPFTTKAIANLFDVITEVEKLEFKIDDLNVIVRPSTVEDLQTERDLIASIDNYSTAVMPPSSVMNIEYNGLEPFLLQKKIDKIIVLFRLFQVSSVDLLSYSRNSSEAILWSRRGGGTTSKIVQPYSFKKINLCKENIAKFVSFCSEVYDLIPSSMSPYETENNFVHLGIAYERYSEVLLSMTSTARKITDTVIALESLLLDDNQEVKFKFALRGAQILGLLNYPSVRVNKCLKVAYDIRSAYVHGSDVDLAKNLNRLDGEDRSGSLR
jgi:Apea-like HEPN